MPAEPEIPSRKNLTDDRLSAADGEEQVRGSSLGSGGVDIGQ
jgi:hypothetical protein